jgi:arabinan endo-1,5-alpha-L-arabinosidase
MRKTTIHACVVLVLSVIVSAAGAGWAQPAGPRGQDRPLEPPRDPNAVAHLQKLGNREIRLHDPSTIAKCKDRYWIFCTGRGTPSFHSKDLITWERGPQTFTKSPEWAAQAVPGNRSGLDFWAPDVIHWKDRYLLYFSVSTFGKNTSAIGLATNVTLDPCDPAYEWKDCGIVVQSSPRDDFNAIDPAVTADAEGNLWMSFGSFWGGIKLIQLDPATGKRISPDSPIHALAHYDSIEAPFIYHHKGAYYLFLNWGMCCRGLNSTYNMRIGRSPTITGPYLDKEDRDMLDGGGTLLLDTDGPFIGPGHAGILKEGSRYWLGMHFYDGATRRGDSKYAIRPLTWSDDGWPVVGTAESAR